MSLSVTMLHGINHSAIIKLKVCFNTLTLKGSIKMVNLINHWVVFEEFISLTLYQKAHETFVS